MLTGWNYVSRTRTFSNTQVAGNLLMGKCLWFTGRGGGAKWTAKGKNKDGVYNNNPSGQGTSYMLIGRLSYNHNFMKKLEIWKSNFYRMLNIHL